MRLSSASPATCCESAAQTAELGLGLFLGLLFGGASTVSVKDEFGVRRDVFACCEDCEDKLDDHPEKYLKNLPE